MTIENIERKVIEEISFKFKNNLHIINYYDNIFNVLKFNLF